MAERIKPVLLQVDHLQVLLLEQPDQQQEIILQQLPLIGTAQEVHRLEVLLLPEVRLEARALQEVQHEAQVQQEDQVLPPHEAQVLLDQVLQHEVQVLLDQVLQHEVQVLLDRVLHLQEVQALQVEVAQAEEARDKKYYCFKKISWGELILLIHPIFIPISTELN